MIIPSYQIIHLTMMIMYWGVACKPANVFEFLKLLNNRGAQVISLHDLAAVCCFNILNMQMKSQAIVCMAWCLCTFIIICSILLQI